MPSEAQPLNTTSHSDRDFWYLRYSNVQPPRITQGWLPGELRVFVWGEASLNPVHAICRSDRIWFIPNDGKQTTVYSYNPITPIPPLPREFHGSFLTSICSTFGTIYMLDINDQKIIKIRNSVSTLDISNAEFIYIEKPNKQEDQPLHDSVFGRKTRLLAWELPGERTLHGIIWNPGTPGCLGIRQERGQRARLVQLDLGMAPDLVEQFRPWTFAFDPDGEEIYFSDTLGHRIFRASIDRSRRGAPRLSSKVLAGNGAIGLTYGPGLKSSFQRPQGLAIFQLSSAGQRLNSMFPRAPDRLHETKFLIVSDSASRRIITVNTQGLSESLPLLPCDPMSVRYERLTTTPKNLLSLEDENLPENNLGVVTEIIAGPGPTVLLGSYATESTETSSWWILDPHIGQHSGTAAPNAKVRGGMYGT